MEPLDIIELLTEIPSTGWLEGNDQPWPADTEGTVLELKSDWALVEISDDNGETLDIIDVPLDQAKVIWAATDHPSPTALDDVSFRAADTRARR